MRRGPDRLNRWLLLLLSVVLIGAGGYGLARGYDAFGAEQADQPLLWEPLRLWVSRNDNLFWPAVLVVCVAVAYLALRWLVAQFRTRRLSELELTSEGSQGSTRLRAAGAAQALAEDIEGYPEVTAASARLLQDGQRPEVDVRVDVHDDADVPGVRDRIEEQALRRFCQALEVPDVSATVDIRLAGPTGRTVR
ncbi:MAG: alkaline shock response membrane anchor protein AmaP [Actinomycetota bacterium]|nr:alkaline shock response membrane anchor protein AmaP [Actinomycetota bacterium]